MEPVRATGMEPELATVMAYPATLPLLVGTVLGAIGAAGSTPPPQAETVAPTAIAKVRGHVGRIPMERPPAAAVTQDTHRGHPRAREWRAFRARVATRNVLSTICPRVVRGGGRHVVDSIVGGDSGIRDGNLGSAVSIGGADGCSESRQPDVHGKHRLLQRLPVQGTPTGRHLLDRLACG